MLPNFQFSNFKFQIIFIFSFFLFSIFYFLPSVAHANTAPQANYPVTDTNPDVPNNLHNWTQNVMIEVMSALTCQLAGIDPVNINQGCLGVDQKTGKIGFNSSETQGKIGSMGAIGAMGNMISILYIPPAHTIDYFQNLAQNFGITKKTYAQITGTGFEGLRPLLKIWTVFRNAAYLVFVLAFVVIGLAIMLRVKIDPRTVMTIQNQIPKIIIGILLITFSYAIAGFLIDIMYVSIHVVGNVIVSSDPGLSGLPTQLSRETNPLNAAGHVGNEGGNAAVGLWKFVYAPAKAITGVLTSFLGNMKEMWLPNFTSSSNPVLAIIMGVIDYIMSLPLKILIWFIHALLNAIIGILAFLIIAIALLIALFRLWFTLINSYVHILLDVALAPFWIVGSLIPGSPISAIGWLRDLIANLAVFPATIAIFLLAKVFMDQFGTGDPATLFAPPMVGDRGSPEAIGAIIGLGMILMTPNLLTIIKTALKAPKGGPSSLGALINTPGGVIARTGHLGSTLYGLSYIPGVNKLPFINKMHPGGVGGKPAGGTGTTP